jgi:hypothetical protein
MLRSHPIGKLLLKNLKPRWVADAELVSENGRALVTIRVHDGRVLGSAATLLGDDLERLAPDDEAGRPAGALGRGM